MDQISYVLVNGPNGGKLKRIHRTPEQLKKDFWERVDIRESSECWEWKMGLNNKNRGGVGSYGVVWMNGRKYKTHRVSYEFTFGEIPKGMLVCHHCDNPPCCNPSHLFLGSWLDNNRDMVLKNRRRLERGADRYNAKLSEEDVRFIRNNFSRRNLKGWNGAKLARHFGIAESMVFSIINRQRWKHVI